MITLKKVDDSNYNLAKEFLLAVPSINTIDEEILKKAIIAIDGNNIIGCISYEEYDSKGLIRYFVFKKIVDVDLLHQLFKKLENDAKQDYIDSLVCVVGEEYIQKLFNSLGFVEVNKDNIYIEEEKIINTGFKDSNFMIKYI